MQSSPRAFVFACAIATLALLSAVFSQRFLYADGAAFFLLNVASRQVSSWDPWRQFAQDITQGPMWLGFAAGCTSLTVLGWLNGAGLFLLPWLALWPTLKAAPKSGQGYVLLAFACFFQLQICASVFVISEAIVAASLGLFCFFYLFFAASEHRRALRRLDWLDAYALLAALLATRAYEFFACYAPCMLWAGARSWGQLRAAPWQRRAMVGYVSLAMAAAGGIGLWGMLFNAGRTASDAHPGQIVLMLLQDPTAWLTSLVLLGGHAALARPTVALGDKPDHTAVRAIPASLAPTALACGLLLGLFPLLPLAWRWPLAASLHYPGRLFALAGPGALFVFMLWRGARAQINAGVLACTLVLAGWMASWQVTASWRFWQYRQALQSSLRAGPTLQPVGRTALADNPFAKNTAWALPSHSLVEQGMRGGPLRAVIVPDGKPGYEPFPAHDPARWPDLSAYGVLHAVEPP